MFLLGGILDPISKGYSQVGMYFQLFVYCVEIDVFLWWSVISLRHLTDTFFGTVIPFSLTLLFYPKKMFFLQVDASNQT